MAYLATSPRAGIQAHLSLTSRLTWLKHPFRLRNFKFRFDLILAQFMLMGYQGLIYNLPIITDQALGPCFLFRHMFSPAEERVRAESVLHVSTYVRTNAYAKVNQIRRPWNFASCDRPGH